MVIATYNPTLNATSNKIEIGVNAVAGSVQLNILLPVALVLSYTSMVPAVGAASLHEIIRVCRNPGALLIAALAVIGTEYANHKSNYVTSAVTSSPAKVVSICLISTF